MLKYEDVSRIEGLDWIEYRLPISTNNTQLLIEVNSIDMVKFLFCTFRLISFQNRIVITYHYSLIYIGNRLYSIWI